MNDKRYQRHSLIDWFSQEDVQGSKVGVIGCGAVGNEVAKNLALLGVGQIDLFDFDTIEIHNLTRSVLFRESDIGREKAEVAAARVKELDPNIEVNHFIGDFWDHLTLAQAAAYDCIICCVDNFEARIKLNQLCILTKTNLINTGIDSKFGQIEVFPLSGEGETACFECNLPNSAYERMAKRYSCGWLKKISFIEKKIPTTIITSSLTGAMAASFALETTKDTPQETARRILLNSATGSSTVSQIVKSETCPACPPQGQRVTFLTAKATIENQLKQLSQSGDVSLTTSEPILVSYRCTACDPNAEDATILFERAAHHDSTLSVCKKCEVDTVEIDIRDVFQLSEIREKYLGKSFPCKYVKLETNENTIIIEME